MSNADHIRAMPSAAEDVEAAVNGAVGRMAEELLRAGAWADLEVGPEKWTPVLLAARHGHSAAMRALLESKANASSKVAGSGATALHLVAGADSAAMSQDRMREIIGDLIRAGLA